MELKLGQRMRDRVTGLVGIATTRTEYMTGNVQFTLQPPIGGAFNTEAHAFDAHQLEYAGDGTPAMTPPTDTGITLGHKVRDIVSGIEGIATLQSTFLNGCVYYTVVPEAAKGATEIKDVFIEYKRLKQVDFGVAKIIAEKLAAEVNAPKTGGPSYSVPARG